MRRINIFIILFIIGIVIGVRCSSSCGAESDRWYSPASYNETVSVNWSDCESAYDRCFDESASYLTPYGEWTSYLELNMDGAINSTEARFFIASTEVGLYLFEVGVYANDEWLVGEIFIDCPAINVAGANPGDYYMVEFQYPDDAELSVSKVRFRGYNSLLPEGDFWVYCVEVDVWGRYEENIGEQGPQGEQGPAGPQGETGPAGPGEANGMPLWYILGLAALAVGSWFSQSIVVNIMLMIFCAGGFELTDIYLTFSQPLYYSIRGVLILGIVFALLQLFTRVKHI